MTTAVPNFYIFLLLFLYVLFNVYKYPIQVASLMGILPLWQPSNITCTLCWLFHISINQSIN